MMTTTSVLMVLEQLRLKMLKIIIKQLNNKYIIKYYICIKYMSSSTKQYLCDCVTTNYKISKLGNNEKQSNSTVIIRYIKKVYNSVITGCDTKQGDCDFMEIYQR